MTVRQLDMDNVDQPCPCGKNRSTKNMVYLAWLHKLILVRRRYRDSEKETKSIGSGNRVESRKATATLASWISVMPVVPPESSIKAATFMGNNE